jgi:hypothetical protein
MGKKTWKVDQDATAGMQVTDKSVQATVATVDGVNGIYVDESGTYIRGKISLMTNPEQIRVGGLWTQPSGWQQMFPSTMAFPNPNLIISPPLKGVRDMALAVNWMMGLLL